MGLGKKIFFSLPLQWRIRIREKSGLMKGRQHKADVQQIKAAYYQYCESHENGIIIKNPTEWLQAFLGFSEAQAFRLDVAVEFFSVNIKCEKKTPIKEGKPILICPVKNDIVRMIKFMDYYRKNGVKNFVIIDNHSDDGTFEFLMEQDDVTVMRIRDTYTTDRREAWINRIIAYYGFDRWYIVVDSDELLSYPGIEEHGIDDLISYAESNSRYRMRAIMVDMYSENALCKLNEDSDYFEQCCYFDTDTYQEAFSDILDIIIGGPRGRVFNDPAYLTKYPVFKFEKGDIQGKSHFQFPYKKNKNIPCELCLLHYKFFPGDLEKIESRVRSGNYHNGSIQYSKYLKTFTEEGNVYAFTDESMKFNTSEDLLKINLVKKIDWN